MLRFVITCLIVSAFLPLAAQETAAVHTFTDKNGKQILATLLSVSVDKRMVKIRREDGQEFELVINVLSLDDQQYIKQQLALLPVEKKDYRLEVDIAKKGVNSESYPYGATSYTLTQEFLTYVVKVRNLSRETLEGAKMEWIVVVDDRLKVLQEEGEWAYDRLADEEENLIALSGEVALSSLPFNQEVVVTTGEIEVNEMLYLRDVYNGDTIAGVIARVVSAEGAVIMESRLGDADFNEVGWDTAMALVAPVRGDD